MRRTATAFHPLRFGGALVVIASICAWDGTQACESKSTSACAAKAATAASAAVTAPATVATTPAAAPTATAPAEAGMRAYLDPESGGVIVGVPIPGEEIAPEQAPPQLQEEVLPDGSVMMDLKGTGQEYMILQVDAAGERSVRCVQDP